MTGERLPDTSVVVAALSGWHEHHEQAAAAVVDIERLPAQVVIETVAVLTRLPRGLAIAPALAVDVVRRAFPRDPVGLSSEGMDRLLDRVQDSGIRGGELYDALVAATALDVGATLVSRDRRAKQVYRAIGVAVELIG